MGRVKRICLTAHSLRIAKQPYLFYWMPTFCVVFTLFYSKQCFAVRFLWVLVSKAIKISLDRSLSDMMIRGETGMWVAHDTLVSVTREC